MHSFSTLLLPALATVATAEVFKFPLANGFPDVSDSGIQALAQIAGGPIPQSSSGGGTTALPPAGLQALQGLAFNEASEVAFFTQLLQNITKAVPGYTNLGADSQQIINALNATQAQEQLHYLNAIQGLQGAGASPVEPCEYEFPASSFAQAMTLADNFSGVLMGTIGAFITDFGGTPTVSNLFSANLAQEGQQDAYFRWALKEIPNANPFITSSTLGYIYSNINQRFVVPGSCPQTLDIPLYNELTPTSQPAAENTTISFSTSQPSLTTSYYIAYMSGQLVPVVVPISNITSGTKGKHFQFQASFPYDAGFSRGLTIAALVSNQGPFANVSEVAASTLAGPGLIQVNYE